MTRVGLGVPIATHAWQWLADLPLTQGQQAGVYHRSKTICFKFDLTADPERITHKRSGAVARNKHKEHAGKTDRQTQQTHSSILFTTFTWFHDT
jgi:hypothetical protein